MTDICTGLPDVKLTLKEENALAKRHTQAAKTKLVMHNMREAVKYAKHISGGTIADDQILSICYEALTNSARKFKPNWARFFAFSKAGLRGALKEHFNKLKIVRNGFTVAREELAENAMRATSSVHGESADAPDVEVLTGEIAEPDFKSLKLREQWEQVAPLLKTLSERESMVIDLHFRAGFSLSDIGEKLGVTCEAIRHTRSAALRKIRNKLLVRHTLYSDY